MPPPAPTPSMPVRKTQLSVLSMLRLLSVLSQAVEEDQQKPTPVMAEALVTDGIAGIGAKMQVGTRAGN